MRYQCLNEECGRKSWGNPVWKTNENQPKMQCSYCQGEVEDMEMKVPVKKTKREKLDVLTKEELIECLIRIEAKSGRRKREIRNMNRALAMYKKVGTLQNNLLKLLEETKTLAGAQPEGSKWMRENDA